ncbi:MAG: glycosyltransferase family 39 protein [Syntrophaceae bacterium]|nr:glycosyltransferase family 39 protein [Syntrophaceae bacterium]
MNKIVKKDILILILCLIIGFALRFYTFDQKSLWIDEIHTYNDSRDDIQGQLKYYKDNPTYLHPPLFFVLTHTFYPFTKPEKDLRILPLIFGVLSMPMFYFLSRLFSSAIALPCTLSLTFMTYHIYFSQDGRMYSLIMFFGMAALYLLMRHLKTSEKRYLIPAAFFFATLFYMSYSTIIFIVFSQLVWLYQLNEKKTKSIISSLSLLIGLTLSLCFPWILFIVLNYKGQPVMDPITIQDIDSFPNIMLGMFNDWAPLPPLSIVSLILLILFPIFSKNKKNSLILVALFILPIGGLYLYCKLLKVTQFITSRYYINFLPLFLITLYLSLDTIELKFEKLKGFIRLGPKHLFLILFILSNLIILFPYYHSEKQDFRSLVNYLNNHLRDGDKLVVGTYTYIPGILHYFNVDPVNRHYVIPFSWKEPGKLFEFKVSLIAQNRNFPIYHSNIPYAQYVEDGNRLWILLGKGPGVDELKKNPSCVLKGYFDGSFAMFRRFPSDASMYLFLWDPKSPGEKGIDIPIE